MRSIYKTFLASGFKVEVLPTDPDPNQRNLLFYASLENVKQDPGFIPVDKIDLADAVILKDEYPVLDMLNSEAAKRWRMLAIGSFTGDIEQRTLPLFE
ncbi:MAG: hypothetical protein K0S44_2048 [Bacteroidetes bacterium]|nr:hypothetical protein [Bacteroidota bacterium]